MSEPDSIAMARSQLIHELHNFGLDLERFLGIASGKAPALAVYAPDSPLDQICEAFALDEFERSILVICAGVEVDSGFAELCGQVNGDPTLCQPTFGLAMACIPGAHWAGLSPGMALRRWGLVEVVEGATIARSVMRIDEAVLQFLLNGFFWDAGLAGLAAPLGEPPAPPPSHGEIGDKVGDLLLDDPACVPQVLGAGSEERRAVIAQASVRSGYAPFTLSVFTVPGVAKDRERLARRWERLARLLGAVLVLEEDEADCGDQADREQWRAARLFAEAIDTPVILSGGPRRRLAGRPVVAFELATPSTAEQQALWADALQLASDDPLAIDLAGAFNIGAGAIRAIGVAVHAEAPAEEAAAALFDGDPGAPVPVEALPDRRAAIWRAARLQLRPRLEALAQRVEVRAGWDQLAVSRKTSVQLQEIADQTRHRGLVRERWGFARGGGRGQGIVALFAGSSGVGKTLAAEVLAHEVGLDLYRIDLSAVVDKYIGETEKNLARLFDAADNGAAILFFDEADVLFGKRTEVKEGRDRYANIEVGYLLQRLETYRGLAILSSNMREGLDAAFVRRIRFIVDFSFPDAEARARLWRIAFPPEAPLHEGVDIPALAALQFSGGQIASIAVNAAYLAAAAGQPIGMPQILAACRQELLKGSQPADHPLLRAAAP